MATVIGTIIGWVLVPFIFVLGFPAMLFRRQLISTFRLEIIAASWPYLAWIHLCILFVSAAIFAVVFCVILFHGFGKGSELLHLGQFRITLILVTTYSVAILLGLVREIATNPETQKRNAGIKA